MASRAWLSSWPWPRSTTTWPPAIGTTSTEKIVIGGAETISNLAQLIDPLSEVRVALDVRVDGNPSLPAEIKTERLLYGGGLAVVGTKDNEITLPFALRSRVLFDDDAGELIFRGYYDGASPEYIKGDPLLLLNVMSNADQDRLRSLCTDPADTDELRQV